MKNLKNIVLLVAVCLLAFALLSCTKKEITVDYSEYPFTDKLWTRDAEHDIETIRFRSDGSYSYTCACGNPVNDSDMNNGYTYDDETKTIKISYFETTEETIPEIKIEMCDGEILRLNFDGEIREFIKEEN